MEEELIAIQTKNKEWNSDLAGLWTSEDDDKEWKNNESGWTTGWKNPEFRHISLRSCKEAIDIGYNPSLPLPSHKYLGMHAACAKVAHLSGASEYVEQTYRRMEDTLVLATDGSSAELLRNAMLWPSPMPAVPVQE